MEFIYKINEESQKVTITGVKDCPRELFIPSTITNEDGEDYVVDSVKFGKVIGVDDSGVVCEKIIFAPTISFIKIFRNKNIKEIVLPEKMVEIPPVAFFCCRNLETVIFPQEITKIGNVAFGGCTSLKEITIPESVKEIGSFAFSRCTSLSKVQLPNQLQKIGCGSFSRCVSLTSISTPKSLEWIDDFTFEGCINLSDVQMHKDQKFRPTSFIGCSSITSLGDAFCIENGILFNKDKTEMYTWLGTQNASPAHIVAPSTIKLLGNGFCKCDSIRSIDLSNTQIKEIYSGSFEECSELVQISLPEGLKKIGKRAFSHCSKLKYINLPNSIEEISVACFNECAIIELELPTGLKEISHYAFEKCRSLTSVTIPLNVKTISNLAFKNCISIKKVKISEGYEQNIHNIFNNSDSIEFEYIREYTSNRYYSPHMTGAYTHGRFSPCPYCGSSSVRTFCDGTAECKSCGGEYVYYR